MVRNNIDAIQTTTHLDDSEFQVLNLKKKDLLSLAPLHTEGMEIKVGYTRMTISTIV